MKRDQRAIRWIGLLCALVTAGTSVVNCTPLPKCGGSRFCTMEETLQVLRSSHDQRELETVLKRVIVHGTDADLAAVVPFLADPGFLQRLDSWHEKERWQRTARIGSVMLALGNRPGDLADRALAWLFTSPLALDPEIYLAFHIEAALLNHPWLSPTRLEALASYQYRTDSLYYTGGLPWFFAINTDASREVFLRYLPHVPVHRMVVMMDYIRYHVFAKRTVLRMVEFVESLLHNPQVPDLLKVGMLQGLFIDESDLEYEHPRYIRAIEDAPAPAFPVLLRIIEHARHTLTLPQELSEAIDKMQGRIQRTMHNSQHNFRGELR